MLRPHGLEEAGAMQPSAVINADQCLRRWDEAPVEIDYVRHECPLNGKWKIENGGME
jgi:hypothetical protein